MVVGGKMRNQKLKLMLICTMLLGLPVLALADGGSWGNYRGVERHDHRAPTTTYHYKDQYGRSMSQEIPIRPQYQRPYPSYPGHFGYPHYPSYPNYQHYPNQGYPYPPQNGLTIIYNHQFPTQTTYSGNSYGYVNGNGTIKSSQYTLISDWRRYGLPDPQVGMHWVYENGRYVQIPNDR